jgi:hypothetical protein
MSGPTQEQPAVTPEVTTRSPWHVSRIPGHLGPARTSTVVLVVLFLAIGTLYLNIRPDPTTPATAGTGSTAPAVTTPAPSEAPATTTPAPETTQDQPTTTDVPTAPGGSTGLPTPTGTPSGTGSTSVVPTPVPTPSATTTSPAG